MKTKILGVFHYPEITLERVSLCSNSLLFKISDGKRAVKIHTSIYGGISQLTRLIHSMLTKYQGDIIIEQENCNRLKEGTRYTGK